MGCYACAYYVFVAGAFFDRISRVIALHYFVHRNAPSDGEIKVGALMSGSPLSRFSSLRKNLEGRQEASANYRDGGR